MEKIPVTEEQFLQTVDRWIYFATGEGKYERCGFCDAVRGKTDCEGCLVYYHCYVDGSLYRRYCSTESWEREQLALKILEVLYDLGRKLGFYKREWEDGQ